MDKGLKVTKGMLPYRDNIIAMRDIDVFILDMETAIEELRFALQDDIDRPFNMKHVNNMVSYADTNDMGMGEAFCSIVSDLEFPFRLKSLFGTGKKVLITKMNGSLAQLEKLDNFQAEKVTRPLFKDQVEAENVDIYDVSEAITG